MTEFRTAQTPGEEASPSYSERGRSGQGKEARDVLLRKRKRRKSLATRTPEEGAGPETDGRELWKGYAFTTTRSRKRGRGGGLSACSPLKKKKKAKKR